MGVVFFFGADALFLNEREKGKAKPSEGGGLPEELQVSGKIFRDLGRSL